MPYGNRGIRQLRTWQCRMPLPVVRAVVVFEQLPNVGFVNAHSEHPHAATVPQRPIRRHVDRPQMKPLPSTIEFYRRTPEFTEVTVPDGLRKAHRTRAGVWGRIVVLEGGLLYRIHASPAEEFRLDRDNPGVIEPGVEHEVEPLGQVRFLIEFYR